MYIYLFICVISLTNLAKTTRALRAKRATRIRPRRCRNSSPTKIDIPEPKSAKNGLKIWLIFPVYKKKMRLIEQIWQYCKICEFQRLKIKISKSKKNWINRI